MGLIITYPPHEDESGMGYYRRLSTDNALFGWRNLAGTAGVERQRHALMTRTGEVAHNLGLNLSSMTAMPATKAQIWLSTQIANGGKFSSGMEPVIEDIDTKVLIKVIRTLCLYADPLKPALSRTCSLPKTVTAAVEFLAPLETLLGNWPMNFRSHVEQRIAAGRKDER